MTRLIIFIASGMLLLISCSDNKEEALEKCTDKKYSEYLVTYSPYAVVRFFKGTTLKEKLKVEKYEQFFKSCETEQKQFPKAFTKKYN
jgi:hypothetical protein